MSRVGGMWGEDTGDEADEWLDLGDRLALHYKDVRARGKIQVPKSQRWCAWQVDCGFSLNVVYH